MSKVINCLECPIYDTYRARCNLAISTRAHRNLKCEYEVYSTDCDLLAIVRSSGVHYPKREPDDPTWRDTVNLARALEHAGE